MKKWLPWIVCAVFALWILSAMRAPREKSEFNTADFGRLPVLLDGRIQPFDSVGLNTLLSMQGKRTVALGERKWWEFRKRVPKLSSTEWLLEVMTRPDDADTRKVFRVQHPDLQGVLGHLPGGLETYSFNELTNRLDQIQEQAKKIIDAKLDPQLRSPYQKDLMHLYDSMVLYRRLKNSLRPESAGDFAAEVELYRKSIKPGLVALQKNQAGEEFDRQDLALIMEFFRRYEAVSRFAYPLVIPPTDPVADPDGWSTIGGSLLEGLRASDVHPAVVYLARIGTGYGMARPAEFNSALAEYKQWLASNNFTTELTKGQREFTFNQFQPFYRSMVVYVAALLIGCCFWLNWSEPVRRTAFYLLLLALVVHTLGLAFRMFLEGRPPVTNLYSSAIFVGWAAVILGAILERIFRDSIGTVTASMVGFVTLIIAHHLSLSGDTMKMLQAVLDTNFWLATHVVVITAGYSAMFIAGALALIYIARGVFTPSLGEKTARSLSRMVYGTICFATLFSFVGTILGGIWADQSWGRFWGWDPKENGALLIVIWCAVILHARWGGMIRDRGLMAMAVFGNIVTSFSWFGTNMLGVGLHSYGFMDEAFRWLIIFVGSQLVFIGLAMLPLRLWKSSGERPPTEPPAPGPSAQLPSTAAAS
jgi:ABC-type transport system involved in cytochrome c biogenesis permease subunit